MARSDIWDDIEYEGDLEYTLVHASNIKGKVPWGIGCPWWFSSDKVEKRFTGAIKSYFGFLTELEQAKKKCLFLFIDDGYKLSKKSAKAFLSLCVAIEEAGQPLIVLKSAYTQTGSTQKALMLSIFNQLCTDRFGFVDADVSLAPGGLLHMFEWDEEEDWAILFVNVGFSGIQFSKKPPEVEYIRIASAAGNGWLVRKEFFEKAGPVLHDVHVRSDDNEYGWRCRLFGYNPYQIRCATGSHTAHGACRIGVERRFSIERTKHFIPYFKIREGKNEPSLVVDKRIFRAEQEKGPGYLTDRYRVPEMKAYKGVLWMAMSFSVEGHSLRSRLPQAAKLLIGA